MFFLSRILRVITSKNTHTHISAFFMFHPVSILFHRFSTVFHNVPKKSPTLSIPAPPGPVLPARQRPPGRQRHRGAPARAPGAAAGRRGAGLPAAEPGADAGEAAAGRAGRLDGVGGNGCRW